MAGSSNFKNEFRKLARPAKAAVLRRFFKTGKGDYGEGDRFLGITVPQIRQAVKEHGNNLTLAETLALLRSPYHEERLAALLLLVQKFQKGGQAEKRKIFSLYLKNYRYINNWDLVDFTAPQIVGAYLDGKDKKIIYRLARSGNLWKRRIAVLSLFYNIKRGDCADALAVIGLVLHDRRDLMHKACGWMLREIGKRCGRAAEENFLRKHYKTMPRTCLRYAIERFSEPLRQQYLDRRRRD